MAEKSSDHIRQNRPPRVQISYEDPYDSEKMVELPFVMGILSDLSGNDSPVEKVSMEERDFVDVTADTLDSYVEAVAPGVVFNTENKLDEEEGGRLGVSLQFRKMEDFNPTQVARQVPALKELLEAREQLANLQRYINSKPKAQDNIRDLLNDPDLLAALAARAKEEAESDQGDEG